MLDHRMDLLFETPKICKQGVDLRGSTISIEIFLSTVTIL